MQKISKHITFSEAIKSQSAIRHGIENIPNDNQLANMKRWASAIFEPVRNHFGIAIMMSSFFRCKLLNKIIGGSKTSQHIAFDDCAAGDIDGDILGGVTNKEIFYFIKDNLEFDQLIWEYGDDDQPAWVHVSYCEGHNRNMVLKAIKIKGKTFYTQM